MRTQADDLHAGCIRVAAQFADVLEVGRNFELFADPNSSGGSVFGLVLTGVNPDLHEERARSWTAGLDIQPESWTGFTASLTYYDTRYKDRIGIGGTPGRLDFILSEKDIWADILTLNPTPAQIAAACNAARDPFPDCLDTTTFPFAVIVDQRTRNIALQITRGIDLLLEQSLSVGGGEMHASFDGSYVLKNETALSNSSPTVNFLNKVGNPTNLRLRAMASWQKRQFGVNFALNYKPAYDDPLSGLGGLPRGVGAWTTMDFGASYTASHSAGWARDLSIVTTVVNVFDRDPPYVNSAYGYDAVNADPYGRLVSLQLVKAW